MSLVNLGSAGAVIVALVLILKAKADGDKISAELKADADEKVLSRLDKIVDRHLAAEEANRKQVGDLAESNRNLFDRVITICTDLSGAVKDLSSSTKANEKAINDLRAEFRSLGGPQAHKALGHGQEDPLPFAGR